MQPHSWPITEAQQAERKSLAGALSEYHAHPGQYLLPVLGDDGLWHLPPYAPPPRMTGGYTDVSAPPIDQRGMTMAEYQAMMHARISAPPSPGSSAKAARLHAEDIPRISARVTRAADKRRKEAEQAAAEDARRKAQGSLFD